MLARLLAAKIRERKVTICVEIDEFCINNDGFCIETMNSKIRELLEQDAATEIERFARGMLARRAWQRMTDSEALRLAEQERRLVAAIEIERHARGYLARRLVQRLRDEAARRRRPPPVPGAIFD